MPEEGGLGAHLTLDLNNQAMFGPDVEWCVPQDLSTNIQSMPATPPCHQLHLCCARVILGLSTQGFPACEQHDVICC